MKNKVNKILACVGIVMAMTGSTYANLFDITNETGRVIFDDVNKQYWIHDLSMFTQQNFQQQKDAINNLEYFGLNHWKMANRAQMDTLFSQIKAKNTVINEVFGISAVSVDFEGDSNNHWMGRYDQIACSWFSPCNYDTTYTGGAYVAWNDGMYHGVQLGSARMSYATPTSGAWVVTDALPDKKIAINGVWGNTSNTSPTKNEYYNFELPHSDSIEIEFESSVTAQIEL